MKELIAIIRMNKMGQTKKALIQAGFPAFTAHKVMGRGKGFVDLDLLRGAASGSEDAIPQLVNGPRLIPKRLLKMVVPDDKVELLVEILMKANQSGNPGDGKIFVLPVIDAIRIRTKETGPAAISEMNG
ncbi:MAG: P-II family nitrogen regulator [bacterium]